MIDKLDYIKLFISKHNFDRNIHVLCMNGTMSYDIEYVILNEIDIPSKDKISINDIIYDIENDLPKDCFLEWIEYCKNNKQIDLKDWMRNNGVYIPKNIDTSNIEKFKNDINNSVNKIKYIINQLKIEE